MGDIEFVLPDHERKIKSARKRMQSLRHEISRTHQTHALLRVSHSGHCAAVHLSISPFKIQVHQEQIFFSSSYDYNLCCTHSESVITPPLIADKVQIIYDTYYQPGQWVFSPKHPEAICHSTGRSCEQAIKTRLDELRRSILPNSQQTSSSSAADLVASTTTQNLNEAGSINPLDVHPGKRHRRNTSENEENNAGHKRGQGSGENMTGFVDQDGQDKLVTEKIIKKIRTGLKNLEVEDGVYFPDAKRMPKFARWRKQSSLSSN
ncbi:hypothetical protein ABVK25_002964 [Lepraria finkii]|uniref:Uncharacterized protein n=1 Tax=Lepraria finkii TaxID=1340010 RepID=A0ABR4BFE8_9LECA